MNNSLYRNYVIVFVAVLLSFASSIKAQITIPDNIIGFFHDKYPGATDVIWQKSLFKYVASFKKDSGEGCFIEFSSNGNWKYTKSDITYASLPTEVKTTYENSLYDAANGWSLSSIDKFESPEIPFAYRLHIYKGTINKKAIYIADSGKMIKVENDL